MTVPAAPPRVEFSNAHVVVVDKPPGVLTVPSRTGAADPRAVLGRKLEAALGSRLWPVHRLDFEVTGLVLFARSAEAHRIANAAFESRRVRKRYRALCENAEKLPALPAPFTWQSLLVRGKRRSFAAPHGKPALTRAVAESLTPAAPHVTPTEDAPTTLAVFTLDPETGRPHQLRVHLATAGFPIAGDTLYGAKTTLTIPDAIALTAFSLEFMDPNDRAALDVPAILELP